MRYLVTLLAFVCFAASGTVAQVTPSKPDDSASVKARRNVMIGRWLGDTPTKDGGRFMHIVDRSPDGSMIIEFRVIDLSGEIRESTEVALWGISGPVYSTMTQGWLDGERFQPADPTDAYFYDAYEVLELTAETFRYRHFTTGNEYLLKKVGPDFEFPQ